MVNPCGFPLLPAFLSFYLGADEERLPPSPTRAVQGLAVGALVAVGFLGLFAVVGLPVSFGASAVADAVPWAGLATGGVLVVVGLAALAGRRVALPLHARLPVSRERGIGSMVLFGIGYGAASLGCTLPIFLALVGASLGAGKVAVFLAYGLGMAVVLMAVAVAVALAREGAARAVRPLLPYLGRVSGALLVASGGYVVYYWARIRFGDTATLADDPIVGLGTRFSARIESLAEGRGSAVIGAAATIVALALVTGIRRRRLARG